MKSIEEMTPTEVKELKEKYRDEFRTLVYKFLKERPLIAYIWLYRPSRFDPLGDSLWINTDEIGTIKEAILEGEKI